MGKSSKNKYQLEMDKIDGANKILCNNKIIVGEKYYAMLLTFFIYTIPFILTIIFFIKLGPLQLYKNIIYIIISSILYVIHIYAMLKGGCTDPGILPRQNQDSYYETNRVNMRYRISGHIQKINFCYSCYLFRPPRTSHCAICDNCVERFDHHCIWLGTCIGKKNYKYFYILLGSLNINAIFQIIFCACLLSIEVKKIKNKEKKGYTFAITIGCIILYNSLFLLIFIGKLFILHTYLVIKGLTFYEYSKDKMNIYPGGLNPYNKYKLFSNKSILFRKNEKSNILDAVSKQEDEINFTKYKKKKTKSLKENIIKYKKEKNQKISTINNQSKIKIKYLKTYQENNSLNIKKRAFGNIRILKHDKKKYTDVNNHFDTSKRVFGNITFDVNGILSKPDNKIKNKNYVSSSESSKEIDFDNNINVVINPYCIIPESKIIKKNNNKDIQQRKTLIKRNENIMEDPLNDLEKKHKKVIFSNL